MPTLSRDTHPEIEAMQIEAWRQMPAWRKLQLVVGLNQTVRNLALSGLRKRNPDLGEKQIQRLLKDLLLGEELAERVYGPSHLKEETSES